MKNSLKNLALLIIIALVSSCNMTDFLEAVDHAKLTCDGKYKHDTSQLKACKNGVDHLQYTAIRGRDPIRDAKVMCEINYTSNQESYNACLKGIHFLFLEKENYTATLRVGEQNNSSELAIANDLPFTNISVDNSSQVSLHQNGQAASI